MKKNTKKVKGFLATCEIESKRYVLFIPEKASDGKIIVTEAWSCLVRSINRQYPNARFSDSERTFPQTCTFEVSGEKKQVSPVQVSPIVMQTFNACIETEEFLWSTG